MRVYAHVATSAFLGAGLSIVFRSIPIGIAAFLSGIFIDLDHLLEGYLNNGKWLNIPETIRFCESRRLKKVYIFLHSYELLLAYALAASWLKLDTVWVGIGLGVTVHMVLDSAFNNLCPNSLFLITRWKVRFEASKILADIRNKSY